MGFVTGISRFILPILALIIIVKCLLTLLLGQPKEKTYGYIIDSLDGERYPLNMWETSIGRSSSCDIVVSYPTVSRFQAVISRRIDGWYIYDLNSKSGIKVNDNKIDKKATIKAGDKLCFGMANYRFEIINDPVQRVGKKKKSPPPVQKPVSRPVPSDKPFRDTRPQNERESGIPVSPDFLRFYDSKNHPDLHFKKDSLPTDFISERNGKKDVYSGSNYIQTPTASSGKRIVISRPRIINRDTNETFVLSGNLVSIGRSHSCDISVTAPNASRRHALLILYEDGWAIDDAGSSAGTFLNGKRVREPQLLFNGDVISIGDDRLYFNA